ncbi:MAG: MFS transporter [Runella sp.]
MNNTADIQLIKNRWWILGALFTATFLNYFDRQTLGTAIEPVVREFGLSNLQRGELLAAFTLTYALAHLFVGGVIDRLRSVRWFFAGMVLAWSGSTLLVGFAQNFEQLLVLRYLLGIWEAVNFPICLMIIARIFPPEQRSLASGIFASGAFLATLAAPPVVVYLSTYYDWRYAFILAGSLGGFWVIFWVWVYHEPSSAIRTTQKTLLTDIVDIFKSYSQVLQQVGFWAVALIGLGIIPSLYFATQWFPTFFIKALDQPFDQALSFKLSLIYFMQDVGLWLGGVSVLWLAKRGRSILQARKQVMLLAFGLMMSIVAVPYVASVSLCVGLLAVYVAGIGIFLGNQHAFKQDVLPSQVATVAALVGFIETGFTFFVLRRIGSLTADTADFTPVFGLLAGLATFAIVVVLVFIRPKYFQIR